MTKDLDATQRNGAASKKTKLRSPNYPVVGLRKALERVSQILDRYKYSPIPLGAVHEIWGYKALSGAGRQTVAALRSFGLVETEGVGDRALVRLSEQTKKILGGHPDHDKLVQECALAPSIYAELWDKYKNEEELPPDETIRAYLRWDRNFNPDSVDGVIADFLDTIALANLRPEGKVGAGGTGSDKPQNTDFFNSLGFSGFFGKPKTPEGQIGIVGNESQGRTPTEKTTLSRGESTMRTDTFTLEEGPTIALQYPSTLTKSSYQDFTAWIEIELRKIGRLVKPDAESEETKQAPNAA